MSERKFWAIIWGFALTAFAIVAGSILMYHVNYANKALEAIKSGADPIEIPCILDNDYGNSSICLVLAAKKDN